MDSEKIQVVADTLEIDNASAEMALKLAEGDLDKALKMEQYVDKKYLVIQGKFNFGGYNKYYGLFLLIADGKEGEILKTEVVISNEAEDTNISLRVDSNVFLKTIKQIDNDNPKQASKLRLLFTDQVKAAKLFEFLDQAKNNDISGITQALKVRFEDKVEEEVELRLRAKAKTETQLKKIHPEFFESDENNEVEDEEEDGDGKLGVNITLNCIPIVSPTFGYKITDLDVGDELLVKVVDQREMGQYLNKLLSSDVGAVAGTIEGINYKEKSERYSVLMRLSSNVYGKIYIEPEIKLATPKSEQEKMERLQKADEKKDGVFSNDLITIMLLGGLILVLLIIIAKLYF
ncbi:hypothetical protein [Halanaerobacter jeridensis]|uniref:Uncharacterized protein n=1 Tax=Halanaerobacter jeridensis TaxID=706427 RepID=A0A939BP88_9FIRM|nr:hypothetical protein [Halanaerobacter jeridensis]MBM7556717.1 hypothetical protein [Halanaerobacter jeridensis]